MKAIKLTAIEAITAVDSIAPLAAASTTFLSWLERLNKQGRIDSEEVNSFTRRIGT